MGRSRAPKTVLFVASIWPTLEGFVQPIAREFSALGLRTIGAAAGEPGATTAFDVAEPLHDFRRRGPLHVLVAARDLARVVRRHKVDVVYLHTPVAVAMGRVVCWVLRVPTVSEIYGSFLGVGGVGERAFRLAERATAWMSRATIVQNETDLAYYRRVARAGTVTLFPGAGIRLDRLRAAAARDHPRTGATATVGVVARITADKGLPFLVDVVRRLRTDGHDVQLRLIGAPVQGDKAWQPPDEPWIEVTGWLADPTDAIMSCDLIVAGSRREGFGMGVAESLILGKRVVALANSGADQQKRAAGERLTIVEPDEQAFAAAIVHALAEPAADTFQEDLAAQWGLDACVRFHREHLLARYPALRGDAPR